jgi:ABC-2 type transport system permease protein
MKSSKSLFNATLFKSNINRFLPFSILFLIIELIIYPLILFFNFDSRNSLDYNSLIPMGIASDAFTFWFAGAFAILVFGYLFTANKCNALHAFPIGRKSLFATNILSAYVLLIVPQLIGFGIAVPGIIMFAKAEIAKTVILLQIATIFLYSFIALSIATLAVMLSGNAFAAAIIYIIINFLYSALVLIASLALSVFGYGLGQDVLINDYSYIFSPVADLVYHISKFDMQSFQGASDFYKALIIYFIAAFAICALAFLLYKLRELEVTGEMAAFEQELPFIRIIVSIIGGAVMSMFIGTILESGKVGFAAMYIVFSFIVYFATQMILKRKFNIFSGMLIFRWVLCCAISIGIVLGLSAYETNYIPEAAKVESANVYTTYNIGFEKDESGINRAHQLQKALIEYAKGNAETIERRTEEYGEELVPDSPHLNTTFTYTLKNGRVVTRNYTYLGDDEKINTLIKALESENEYRNIFDSLDSIGVDYSVKSITISDYTGVESLEYTVSASDFDNVLELCKQDAVSVTENYSSLDLNNEDTAHDIWIVLSIPKRGTDKKLIEDLAGKNYIEGYFSLDEYSNSKAYELDISINKLPKDSKTLQFAKENQ